jgi:tetratricopeptide (TPR) repeat protein
MNVDERCASRDIWTHVRATGALIFYFFSEAPTRMRRAMGLFGSSYHGLCKKGIQALESGDVGGASELFLKAMRMDPSQPRAFGWLGYCYVGAADYFWRAGEQTNQREYLELAIKAFDEAIVRQSDAQSKADFWWQKGMCLRALGRDDSEALQEADKQLPGFNARRKQTNLGLLEQSMRDAAGRRDK